MEEDKCAEDKSVSPAADKSIEKNLMIKTATTDSIKNAGKETPGLNQAATTRDDLLPSDGDNLTN